MIPIATLQPIGQRRCVSAPWTIWSLLLLLTVWAPLTYGQTESSSFEDGSYAPYVLETCCGNDATVVAPTFGARNGLKVLKFFWAEDNWDPAVNSRTMRGIECRSDRRAKEDQWFGFSMYVPSQEFPSNKNIILAQLISFSSACPTDKTVVLSLTGTTLKLEGYRGNQTTNVVSTASGTLTTALPRDRWIDVVIHARYSKNGTGLLEGWFDGAPLSTPTFRATNINLSTGCFDANDNLLYGCYPKFGMYCYDTAGYTDHETRTVYYDDVKWLDGNPANAYDAVKPAGSVPNCGTKLPWTNAPFTPEAGAFVAETDVTPNANRIDGVVGLASGTASGYAGVACAVLFSPDGTIKARNGSAYTALEVVPYSANASYHVLIEVNVPTRKYNVYVTTPDGIRHTIGQGISFRTEQNTVTQLNTFSLKTESCQLAATPVKITNDCSSPFVASRRVDTEPPVVTKPADVTASAGADNCRATVTAGMATATDDCSVTALVGVRSDTLALTDPYPVGVTSLMWTATDQAGNTAQAAQTITVQDIEPPVINKPADVIVSSDPDQCQATLTVGIATATDGCSVSTLTGVRSDNLTLTDPYPAGTTSITWTATDQSGNTAQATQTITVQDKQAPALSLSRSSSVLWPPNHDFHAFRVADLVQHVSDNCQTTLPLSDVRIASVSSDEERIKGKSGSTAVDIVIGADCQTALLRAERAGSGNGRVYTITLETADSSGNKTTATHAVHVPHSPAQTPAVDDGPAYAVMGQCGSSGGARLAAGFPETGKAELILYPNPAQDAVTVVTPAAHEEPVKITVSTSAGRLMTDTWAVGSTHQLRTSDWPAGLYLVTSQTTTQRITQKLIIAR